MAEGWWANAAALDLQQSGADKLADADALSFSEATAGSAPEKACRHPRGCWFHAGAPSAGRDG